MLTISKISIEGFGSFQHKQTINLNRGGLNLVNGKNGHGKTTIFSALYWGLYGENLKGVKNAKLSTWEKIRSKLFKGTRVMVWLNISGEDYVICRHLGYKGMTAEVKGGNSIMILDSDGLVGEAMHKGDQQSYINQKLGMDSRVFINAILFGQRMTRLIQASNDEKRKLLEELFELHFVEQAKQAGKEKCDSLAADISALRIEVGKYDSKLQNLDYKIKTSEEFNERIEKDIQSKEGLFVSDKADLDQELTVHCDTLKTSEKQLKLAKSALLKMPVLPVTDILNKEYTDTVNELSRETGNLRSLQREITVAKQNVAKYAADLENVSDTCPSCNGKLKAESLKTVKDGIRKQIAAEQEIVPTFEKKVIELGPVIENLEKEKERILTALAAVKEDLDKHTKAQNEVKELERVVRSAEDKCRYTESKITKLMSQWQEFKDNPPKTIIIEEIQKEIEAIHTELEIPAQRIVDLTKEKERYDWWVSKGFGATGLKSFVFNSMLSKMNSLINKYANRLGVNVVFSVDLTKASKPFMTEVYKDGIPVDYDELSGGQKQRIDVCLAFTMFDLVSHQNPVNLMILDEVLEGLDDDGVEEVFDLVRSKVAEGKTVYMITHQSNVDTFMAKTMKITFDGVTSKVENE